MTVTVFLFTDLVSSTALLSEIGDTGMDAVRRTHFALLRESAAASAGWEVKNLGDGLLVAFANASEGVSCAINMQRAVERENRRSGRRLAIRIGIDLGEATEESGDYFGASVVLAKRLCDAAGAGEIYVTDIVRALAASRGRYKFERVGPVPLKGVPEPVGVFAVDWTDDEPFPLPPTVTSYGDDPPPFVGRDSELMVLAQRWEEARTGHLRVLLLTGEPGVGKTRLACEFARNAWASGAVVLAGRSTEGLTQPYQPFIEALRHYARFRRGDDLRAELGESAEILGRLVPELLERLPAHAAVTPNESEMERLQLFETVSSVLSAVSSQAPVLLLLDDLQWADQASLQLLKYLVRAPQRAALLVLATYRDVEVPRSHPLAHALEELHREHVDQRLSLEGLSREEAARFVDGFLGEALPALLVEDLWRETGGNPLFIEELVRSAREGGHSPSEGAPRLSAGEEPGTFDPERWLVASGVRDTLWQRLHRLSPGSLDALRTASVIGVEFDLDVLAAVLGRDEAGVVRLLDEAVLASLLTEVASNVGRYRFSHGLIRQALYDDHTVNGRAQLHARIGDTMERLKADDQPLPSAELTYHYARSGPRFSTKLLTYSLAAGEQAMNLLAYEDAEAQFASALDTLATTKRRSDTERARALIGLAEARRAEGHPAASRASCLEAAGLARAAGDAELLARAAIDLALPGAAVGMDFGALDQTRVDLLEEALSALPAVPSPLRLRALVHLVFARHLSSDVQRRRAVASEAVAVAAELGEPALRAAAIAALHSTQWGRTPLSERLAASAEIVRLAIEGQASQTELDGHIALAIDQLEAADLPGVLAQTELVRSQADRLRQPFYRWYSSSLEASCAGLAGRYADGASRVAEAERYGAAALGRRPIWGRIAWDFVTGWDLGTLEASVGPLVELRGAFPGTAVLDAALAHAWCTTERHDEARQLVAPWLGELERVPEDSMWLFTLALLAEACWCLGEPVSAADVDSMLAPTSGRLVVVGSGVACFGAADRSRGVLALTRGRLDDAVEHLERAIVLQKALGARPWIARTQGLLALALLQRGRSADLSPARRLLREAGRSADELGATGLASWIASVADAAPASRRVAATEAVTGRPVV